MNDILEKIIGVKKPVIGMAHFQPLPGNYLYDDDKGVKGIMESIEGSVRALQDGGVDAIMFCNENDRPYSFKASPAAIATMAYVIGHVKSLLKVPFGVDVLWDPLAAIGLAKATGATFIREIFTNVYSGDMGMLKTNCNKTFQYRKLIGGENIKCFFTINAEFSAPLVERPYSVVTKSIIMSSLPDAILISGPITGKLAELNLFKEIKEAAGDIPVLANTGVTHETIEEILEVLDGVIIGTAFKIDGVTWNPVSQKRVKKIMDLARAFRGKSYG